MAETYWSNGITFEVSDDGYLLGKDAADNLVATCGPGGFKALRDYFLMKETPVTTYAIERVGVSLNLDREATGWEWRVETSAGGMEDEYASGTAPTLLSAAVAAHGYVVPLAGEVTDER